MIDYLRNLFISWFNKILNWFSERHKKKEMNTKKEIPFDKNKHADDDRQKRISEGFQALDEGCKSIANLRAEIEMSQTNNDLDAPVPANKQNKGNPLFQRDASVAMANGCVANERHYVSNNIKNIGGNNMGNFFGPKTPEDCQKEIEKHEQKIKDLEKKKLELENKEGVAPIKPVQEKVLPSNISPISMRSNNDNSNWIDPNDLNNTFEYQDEKVQKAMKGENNKMGELINKKAEKIKQEIKKEIDDKFSESTNDMNKLKEDVKEMKKDITDTKTRFDKYDIMIAEMKQQTAEIHKTTLEMKEDKKAHDELMAALWNKLDEWNGIKQPTRNRDDNRESTNTSFSSFKYKNPFRNNTRRPKMERADMAQEYDNEN